MIRQIQLLAAENQEITAIALAECNATRTQAFAIGFKLVLSKPIEPSELVAAIASVTGRLG